MAIESLTGDEDKFFDMIETDSFTRPPDTGNSIYRIKLWIGFELNSDVTLIQRNVYNSFMLLGDVGGLQGILLSIGAIIVSIFTYNTPENFLAKNLYAPQASVDDNDIPACQITRENELDPSDQSALKSYLWESLPTFCLKSVCLRCLRPNKRD